MGTQGLASIGALFHRRSEAFERARAYVAGEVAEAGEIASLQALTALRGGERRTLERLLMQAPLEPRIMTALGVLGTPRAEQRLREVFAFERTRLDRGGGASGAVLIAAAAALWRLGPQELYVHAIAQRLAEAPSRGERMDAADALSLTPSAAADEALYGALDEPDPLVRHVAARSLMRNYGVALDAHVFQRIVYRVMAREEEATRFRARQAP